MVLAWQKLETYLLTLPKTSAICVKETICLWFGWLAHFILNEFWVHMGIPLKFHCWHQCTFNKFCNVTGNASDFLLGIRWILLVRLTRLRCLYYCLSSGKGRACREHQKVSWIASIWCACIFMLPWMSFLSKVWCLRRVSIW